jgi:cephalosporin-C deacetylase
MSEKIPRFFKTSAKGALAMRYRLPLATGFLLCLVTAIAAQKTESALKLSVVTDRPDALYSVGEMVTFLVTLKQDSQTVSEGQIDYELDKDGVPPLQKGTVKLNAGKASITGTLTEPGFLQCRIGYASAGEKKQTVAAMAGAGFDPLQIKPSMPVPDDFDAFWAEQKARLAKVPMEPKMTEVKSPVRGIECFDVQIPCVPPRPASGYFARPSGAKPKSLPAIISFQGAGVKSAWVATAAQDAKKFNALSLNLNAHGIPNGKPKAFYADLDKGELKGYRAEGRENRDGCYFLGMILRLVRAMEFLTSQPEWDSQVLIVQGSSQGGGQALAAAGLDPRVTFISAGVPALCDHSGKAVGRINGWPKIVPDANNQPDPKILQVARYFDGMNFATRTKAEAVLSVGFIDVTCPPTSVYSAYNNLSGTKKIVCEPLKGHAIYPSFSRISDAAIAEHIAKRKGP